MQQFSKSFNTPNYLFPKIKAELIKKNSQSIHDSFSELISKKSSKTVNFVAIEQKLKGIWELTRGSALSYTSLPETALTEFLIQVGYEVLSANSTAPPH